MTEAELVELGQRAEQRERENAPSITFRFGTRTVGQLYYDPQDHDFKFDGELDASAKIFADLVIRELKDHLMQARH